MVRVILAADCRDAMQQIRLYTRGLCGWCQEAKAWLQEHQLPFEEIDVGSVPGAYEEMKQLSGQHYVPTIVVDGHVLADFDVKQLEQFVAKMK
jgi:glutaredoxin